MSLFIPRPKGSGDKVMSLELVCHLSLHTSVHKLFCPPYNLNTVWNILMILHSYVEQVMTMYHVE